MAEPPYQSASDEQQQRAQGCRDVPAQRFRHLDGYELRHHDRLAAAQNGRRQIEAQRHDRGDERAGGQSGAG